MVGFMFLMNAMNTMNTMTICEYIRVQGNGQYDLDRNDLASKGLIRDENWESRWAIAGAVGGE
jgi:hypothetical protein